jgi:hypothetical protein
MMGKPSSSGEDRQKTQVTFADVPGAEWRGDRVEKASIGERMESG